MPRYRLKAYLSLLAVSFLWGISPPIIKYTLGFFSADLFLIYRFLISLIFGLVILIILKSNLSVFRKNFPLLTLYGFLTSTLSLGLLFLGLTYTSAISASLIFAIEPVIAAILGIHFLHEHVTKKEKIGIAIAFTGTMLVIIEPFFTQSLFNLSSSLKGNVLIFLAVISASVSAILGKIILRKNIEPFQLSVSVFFVGFITLIPFILIFHPFSEIIKLVSTTPLNAHLGVWYMAIVAGIIGYTLWHKGEKSIEVGEASLFTYLRPLWAAPLAYFWLGEIINVPFVIAAFTIALGVYIAERK